MYVLFEEIKAPHAGTCGGSCRAENPAKSGCVAVWQPLGDYPYLLGFKG
jgi:hypothetical protein